MPTSKADKALRAATRYLLLPVARVMIRGGVTWKEFAELSKGAFVEAAGQDYGIDGRQTNASRVALLTGLSRREVARVRGVLDSDGEEEQELPESQIPRLLSGWHHDPDFLDPNGLPRVLSKDAEQGGFRELLKRYAGDIPPVAFTKELVRLGLVKEVDGNMQVMSRNYTPGQSDPAILRQAGIALHDHASTVAFNLQAEREGPPRFERMVTNLSVSPAVAEQFHELLHSEGQKFLERLDAWLAKHEHDRPFGPRRRPVRVGAGIYYILSKPSGGGES